MHYTSALHLPVPAARAWAVLSDIRRWPDWTPTVTAVHTAGAALHVGQRVTLAQPHRRPVRYTIELVDTGRRFRWGSNHGGVRQQADHLVTPDGEHACIVDLTFAMTGPLGAALGHLGASTIRAMVDAETTALTAHLDRKRRPTGPV